MPSLYSIAKDHDVVFDSLFSPDALYEAFKRRFSNSGVKGVDRRSGFHFSQIAAQELADASRKCLDGSFRFSPYLESLKSKGRGKAPRVIGIPTIRDRIVLHQLNRFLTFAFPDCVPRNVASSYVREIASDLKTCDRNEVWVCGCDIRTFYDSIRRDRLMKLVQQGMNCHRAVRLIRGAVAAPIVPKGVRRAQYRNYKTEKGIPQGLAVSNILASIYLRPVDLAMAKCGVKYFRYVDDVLMYGPKDCVQEAHRILRGKLRYRGLSVHPLNTGKSHLGPVTTPFGYLGYFFDAPRVTVRPSTVERFLQSLAGKFSEFAHNKSRRLERYKYLNEERLNSIFLLELNERITGAISENRRYGWVAYFSEINDLSLLYRLDRAIATMFRRLPDFDRQAPKGLKKLSRAIYEIKFNPEGGYVHNYDRIATAVQKLQFLVARGRVGDDEQLTEDQIEDRFARYRHNSLAQMYADEGVVY